MFGFSCLAFACQPVKPKTQHSQQLCALDGHLDSRQGKAPPKDPFEFPSGKRSPPRIHANSCTRTHSPSACIDNTPALMPSVSRRPSALTQTRYTTRADIDNTAALMPSVSRRPSALTRTRYATRAYIDNTSALMPSVSRRPPALTRTRYATRADIDNTATSLFNRSQQQIYVTKLELKLASTIFHTAARGRFPKRCG